MPMLSEEDRGSCANQREQRHRARFNSSPERRSGLSAGIHLFPQLPLFALHLAREGAEVMPLGKARQNVRDDAAIAKSDRRCSPISARNGSANSLSFCCPTPAICANSLLLCGHECAIWRSVASEKII